MIAWTSSGSSFSDIAVKPDTSENITVTIFRSPSMALLEVRIFSREVPGGVGLRGCEARWAAPLGLPLPAAPTLARRPPAAGRIRYRTCWWRD